MIITEYVLYRGKKKLVGELSDKSDYKVIVRCPDCLEDREVHLKSVRLAGHSFCLKCIKKLKQRKYLTIGDSFNSLTVTAYSENSGYSLCKCVCGEIAEVRNWYSETNHVKSCGCLKKESFAGGKKVSGEEHGMWKGGISSERERHMQTAEYKNWRNLVYERDNYTCQCCGDSTGGNLNAHHIEPYAKSKGLRTIVNNGTTLCESCHVEFHNIYGRKDNDVHQIEEFYSSHSFT